jgi:TolA-binding protein
MTLKRVDTIKPGLFSFIEKQVMIKSTGLLFFALIVSFLLPAQNTLVKTSDDQIFRAAIELLEREKYGSAREMYQRYVDLNRNDLNTIESEYYIAFCALNLFHADAEKLFENFIAKYPFHSKAALAYYDLGTFYYSNKDYEKTITYFEKSDASRLSKPQRLERSFKLGYAYFARKDFEKI